MAKSTTPIDTIARDYADRLVLEKLTELYEAVKPSEIADLLKEQGLGLAAVRALLASNPERFAFSERRWVPAARVSSEGRPISQIVYTTVDRFGAPMPISLVVLELSRLLGQSEETIENSVRRIAKHDASFFMTLNDMVGIDRFVFKAVDETQSRAYVLNGLTEDTVNDVAKKVGNIDWTSEDAIVVAVEKAAPVSVKALGAVAWKALDGDNPRNVRIFDWKAFNAELLSVPGFVYDSSGVLWPESEAKNWVSSALKMADKLDAVIEVEDSVPLEFKKADVEECIALILKSEKSVTATDLLENKFEVTPIVKTFPDDLANMMAALNADKRVKWVGGDRFRKPANEPDFVNEVPEPFKFVDSGLTQEDGDPVDALLNDEGLSSSLRKLISHPLATDVLDEDINPAPKTMPESIRLVLKPIHRELGTFPMCQFPTGWFGDEPNLQELIFTNKSGEELQVWLNHDCRLLFNLFDWWLDQPVESGAVFQLTKTKRPNVFEFDWLEQTDPVVYISGQRMEELRQIASESEGKSTFELLREVMAHWPKGADFLTVLWEINVVRRTSRRLLASLFSSYVCFYQRSGSPVWHFDHKKVEQGFDKTKKKFILKD